MRDVRDTDDLNAYLDAAESFAALQNADYNSKLTDTLWRMMNVQEDKRSICALHCKCSCGEYMHYLICPHVMYLVHMHHKQLSRPNTLRLAAHVNKGARAEVAAHGAARIRIVLAVIPALSLRTGFPKAKL